MEHHGKSLLLVLAALVLGTGCGTVEPHQPHSGCSAGAAAIGVTDGLVAILCGCDQAGGQWVANGANLQCTVPSGTTVVFHYISPMNRHQIVSKPTETDVFAPSGVFNPDRSPVIRAHAVTVTGPGTDFEFTDQFDSSLSARITVR